MFYALDQYLTNNVPPETKAVFEESFSLMQAIGFEEFDDGYEDLIVTDQDAQIGDTLYNINDLTIRNLDQILIMHGIKMSDDASVKDRNRVLDAIIQVQLYDDPVAVLAATALATNTEETFAEMISLFTTISADRVLEHIEEVSDRLLKMIREKATLQEQGRIPLEDMEQRQRHLDKLHFLQLVIPTKNSTFFKLMDEGLGVGFPLEAYLRIVGPALAEKEPKDIAVDLVAICMASSDAIDREQIAAKQHIQDWVHDTAVMTKVSIEITNIMMELNRHE